MRWGSAAVLVVLLSSCVSVAPRVAPVQQPTEWEQLVRTVVELEKQEKYLESWVTLQNSRWRDPPWDHLVQEAGMKLLGLPATPDLSRTLVRAGLQASQPGLPPAEPPVPKNNSSPVEWIQGTVTVIVNRGLKLESGTASPDIVIGSGFFVDPQGFVLTNEHVIASVTDPLQKNSPRIWVRLSDSRGERLPAKLVGWDKNSDLALLKVEYKPTFVFSWSRNPRLEAGQRLRAVGSPGGFEASVTEGIVSSLSRPLLPLGNAFQIDVAVNPGNSGGPLVDEHGLAVGVVFAGIAEFQGVNFAIPGTLAQQILPRLRWGGRAQLPWLGAGLQEDFRGVEIVYVLPQGAADRVGLSPGDRLLAVDGQNVLNVAQAQSLLLDYGIGEALPLVVERGCQRVTFWTTLDVRPDDPLKVAFDTDLTGRVFPLAFGIEMEDLGTPVDRNFRVKRVWAGSDGEALQLAENDPVVVLDWQAEPSQKVVTARVAIKRRLGGYFETQVVLSAPWSFRQFL